jgi:hypothetical protein
MGQAIPTQHPAVVLRSHYTHLRILLAIAMIAVVSLTAAVVILATNDGAPTAATTGADPRSATAATVHRVPSHATVHGGVPVPDARFAPLPNGRRFDGGPDEGTRGGVAVTQAPGTRADGGPEEGSRGSGH